MIINYENGTIGGMRIGKGNQSLFAHCFYAAALSQHSIALSCHLSACIELTDHLL
jgi:hypothetical protein